jgi:hypothetical protein
MRAWVWPPLSDDAEREGMVPVEGVWQLRKLNGLYGFQPTDSTSLNYNSYQEVFPTPPLQDKTFGFHAECRRSQ